MAWAGPTNVPAAYALAVVTVALGRARLAILAQVSLVSGGLAFWAEAGVPKNRNAPEARSNESFPIVIILCSIDGRMILFPADGKAEAFHKLAAAKPAAPTEGEVVYSAS